MTCVHGYHEFCYVICNFIMFFKVCLHSFISTNIQARKTAVEKDLVRARKMAKDLLDERVVVNAESEQKRENLNVSIL